MLSCSNLSTQKGNIMPLHHLGRENAGDINLFTWTGAAANRFLQHGWPLSADAFEDQMFFLASRGYRCIAHDRRGHGRSSQPWNGNDMDTYADDVAALVETLDLRDAIHVGHSTGGAKSLVISASRHKASCQSCADRCSCAADVEDSCESRWPAHRSVRSDSSRRPGRSFAVFKDLTMAFYGYNRTGAKVSEGIRDSFWLQGMMRVCPRRTSGIKAFFRNRLDGGSEEVRCAHAYMHGDDDQIVPIGAAALLSSKLVKGSTLKVYPGLPHGMCSTHKDQINTDLAGLPSNRSPVSRKGDRQWRSINSYERH